MKAIDLDIYRAAKILVKEHGPAKALVHADKNLQMKKNCQDREGAFKWARVKEALIELNDLDPTGHKIQ